MILGKYNYLEELDHIDVLNLKNLELIYDLLVKTKGIMNLKNISIIIKEKNKFHPLYELDIDVKNISFDDLENDLLSKLKLEKYIILNKQSYSVVNLQLDVACGIYDSKNEVIGVLLLGSKDNGFFDSEDFKRFEKIRKVIEKNLILEIEYKKDNEQSQSKSQKNIMEVTKRLIEIREQDVLCEHIKNFVSRNVNVENVQIFILKKSDNKHYDLMVGNFTISQFDIKHPLIEQLFFRQEILYLKDVIKWAEEIKSPNFIAIREVLEINNIEIVVPLIFEKLIGFILIGNKINNDTYNTLDEQVLNLIGYSGAIALENILLLEESIVDGLTGLYNKKHFASQFNEQIMFTIYNKSKFSYILIDIDNFKSINDTHGHLAGDDVLKNISKILKECLRINDVVARWGGEEFAILLSLSDLEESREVAERIRASVEAKVRIGNNQVITISVGLAHCEFKDEIDLNTLNIKEIASNVFEAAISVFISQKRLGKIK